VSTTHSGDAPVLHPSLRRLAGLVGTWAGDGTGHYPTMEPFVFREELVFAHSGKPFLTYTQRTWSGAGAALHAEVGYVRCPTEGTVELVIAQPTGIVEIDEGTVADDNGLELVVSSSTVGRSSSAKHVTALRRRLHVVGDRLEVTVDMAAMGEDLTEHLRSTLTRQ
jgi:hypothetical protein